MSVYKSEDNTSWYVMTRYTNYKGERKQNAKEVLQPNVRHRSGNEVLICKNQQIWI